MLVLCFFGEGEVINNCVEGKEGEVDAVCLIPLLLIEFKCEHLATAEVHHVEFPFLHFYAEYHMGP